MDTTTLVTFVFERPARSVHLLGSWDNFNRAYRMQRDARRGPSTWAGCYRFRDIICDGDPASVGARRDGALKMGGTYWYYFKVDGDDECHNPSQPSTTQCPLLPGQRLNLLDVPVDAAPAAAHTLQPEDRYCTPVPPKPAPRLADFCQQLYSADALSGPATLVRGARAATSPAAHPPCSRLRTTLSTLRRTASARRLRDRAPRHAPGAPISPPTLVSSTAEDMAVMARPKQRAEPAGGSGRNALRSHPVEVGSVENQATVGESADPKPAEPQSFDPLSQFDFGFARESVSNRPVSFRCPVAFAETIWDRVGASSLRDSDSVRLSPTAQDVRPASRHGPSRDGAIAGPLLLNKELPKFPACATPEPLFCSDSCSPDRESHPAGSVPSECSFWGSELADCASPATVSTGRSPTFSSATSASELETPLFSACVFTADPVLELPEEDAKKDSFDHFVRDEPPLLQLHGLSSDLDSKRAPNKPSVCVESAVDHSPGPPPKPERALAASPLDQLVDDFGHLGEAVA